ncbi:hypothetical protein [Novilysobacter defluvii]|uniref:Uncharacterized protein n=1 Tax=Lysobacter defluvii IMMIB APB-9 = DSM 18482 TaxID=1385515 RepID=A0A0A0M8Y4_9GAMM|nr:hypothetical protein [Lysobacter defluvii]KGO99463.1 hypothetical protein N791_07370 [Lysobacter defluvii IMMIB APB-9 = DSM 18482]
MGSQDENRNDEQPANEQQDSRDRQSITPEQAMENTRELLERKNEAAQQQASQDQPGSDAGRYQDEQARLKAQELHHGEMRLQANQGSISTRDRHNQGRRDSR